MKTTTRASAIVGVLLLCAVLPWLFGTAAAAGRSSVAVAAVAAANCTVPSESGAAVPQPASGSAAVRWTIGVAKTMNVSRQGP